MTAAPHILLINPWIHDFAAYDFWAKPLGLLVLAALLRQHGCTVSYIDCLDRFHPRASATDPQRRCGRGPYLKTRLPKPAALPDVPRRFSRYGIKPEWLREDLRSLPRPDVILVTSMMTYWYSGVQETIGVLRDIFVDVPLILGGIYATLCRDHARLTAGADRVVSGAAEAVLLDMVAEVTGFRPSTLFDPQDLDTYPHPAHDLQHRIGYVPLLTAKGCPFACAYCAAKKLNPDRVSRSPEGVVDEIGRWHRDFGVRDFVFYDDALLMQAEHHAVPLFEGVIRHGPKIRFHTPNALHIRWITPAVACLMKRAGFETVRLGLETAGTIPASGTGAEGDGRRVSTGGQMSEAGRVREAPGRGLPSFRTARTVLRRDCGIDPDRQGQRRHADPGSLLPHPPHRFVARRRRRIPLRSGRGPDLHQQRHLALPQGTLFVGDDHPSQNAGSSLTPAANRLSPLSRLRNR